MGKIMLTLAAQGSWAEAGSPDADVSAVGLTSEVMSEVIDLTIDKC